MYRCRPEIIRFPSEETSIFPLARASGASVPAVVAFSLDDPKAEVTPRTMLQSRFKYLFIFRATSKSEA
jgi:hypothetical protein